MDVRCAFLQAEQLDRKVYMMPPEGLKVQGKIWLLKKPVYGLNDSSRLWYEKLSAILHKLKMKKSLSDPAIFYYRDDKVLNGIIAIHVDDLYWAGNDYFSTMIILNLRKELDIGREERTQFKHLGISITNNVDFIEIDQKLYLKALKSSDQSKNLGSNKLRPLDDNEKSTFRGILGQLNWLAYKTGSCFWSELFVIQSFHEFRYRFERSKQIGQEGAIIKRRVNEVLAI